MNVTVNDKPGTGTVNRVTTLLALLADTDGPVSVRHVSEQLSLAPSTAHRLLNLLVDGGFASFDARTSTYGIGPDLYRVSARISANRSPSVIARNVIQDLAGRYDETVLFALWLQNSGKIAFMERADGQKKLLYRVDMNTPLSLVWGASGKAALAYLPEEEIERVLAAEGASPATGDSPPDAAKLKAELASIRAKGFCVSRGEKLPGAFGIAAPVFDGGGVIGTICLTMPRDRAPSIPADQLGAEVVNSAKGLSEQLGGSPP